MNRRARVLVFGIVATLSGYWIVQAGSLEPSGPPAPTMKDLETVEPRVALRNQFNTLTPIVIDFPGSYYLAEDIFAFPAAHGIEILASDVTLDLNGFTIFGNIEVGSLDGIHGNGLTTQSSLTIRNGTVRNFFGSGILLDLAHTVLVQDVRALTNFGGVGIAVGPNSRVQNSLAEDNDDIGISVGVGSTIDGCTARDNDSGFSVSASTLVNSAAYSNDGFGIVASSSLIKGNSAVSNGGGNLFQIGSTVVDNHTP